MLVDIGNRGLAQVMCGIGDSFQCDERGAKELFNILQVDNDGVSSKPEELYAHSLDCTGSAHTT